MERRRDLRFDISLKCRVRREGQTQAIEGTTLNLSRSGALIRINGGASLEAGDVVVTEVPLPPHRLFNQRCLACKGVAVRAFEQERGWLVAVQFDHLEFRPLENGAAPVPLRLPVM
jgi:c-di-GMP-binding flagellar brake protein YcgR